MMGEIVQCESRTGNQVDIRSYVDSGKNLYFADTGLRLPHDGQVSAWRIYAKKSRDIELVIYRGEPGSLDIVGRSGLVTPEPGVNEFQLSEPIDVKAGDIVGWHSPGSGALAFTRSDGPWAYRDLRGRVLFASAQALNFKSSGQRVYSIEVVSTPYPSAESGEVKITEVSAAGDSASTFVELTNHGESRCELSGWRLRSSNAGDFVFPTGTYLGVGQVIRVYTDLYDPATGGFTFGHKTTLWRELGDEALLVNSEGEQVDRLAYGDRYTPPLTLVIADSVDAVTGPTDPECVDFTVLQLNDVYDVTPVEGGRRGGLARVATLRAELEAENPNLLSVLVGDFLSPSAIGATTGDGGRHMIEALNAMQLSHVTIGNHEFDVGHDELLARIHESEFTWISSNVSTGEGEPFAGVARHELVEFANQSGHSVRIALLGVCIDIFKKDWISYKNPVESAREQVSTFQDRADLFLTMTHLTIDQDKQLGAEVPRLDVLMGGHEHEAATAIVGDDATPIFKADSNARSACVHRFRFDTRTGVAHLHTDLRQIDESIEPEPKTAAVVEKWQSITYNTLRAKGNEPLEVVGLATEDLDGREAEVRNRPTNLTRLITETFLQEVSEADAVILGAGQVRIDGIIPPGDILFYDVVRIFPVNSGLSLLRMPGKLIRMLLDRGKAGAGTGAYVHVANISEENETWMLGGAPMLDDTMYKIVMTELPSAYLAYPPFKGTGTEKIFDTRDMRSILADRLRRDRAAQP